VLDLEHTLLLLQTSVMKLYTELFALCCITLCKGVSTFGLGIERISYQKRTDDRAIHGRRMQCLFLKCVKTWSTSTTRVKPHCVTQYFRLTAFGIFCSEAAGLWFPVFESSGQRVMCVVSVVDISLTAAGMKIHAGSRNSTLRNQKRPRHDTQKQS
jgi:hypothetical protein